MLLHARIESKFRLVLPFIVYRNLFSKRNATSKVSEFFFLIPSLEKLALFKICEHINKNHDKKLAQLREVARNCLWNILWHGNTNAIKQLVNYSYVEMLVISISTGGGCVQQQNNEIDDQLQILSDFFLVIRKGRYPYQQQLGLLQVLLPLPSLAKVVEELVEQIGGVEEIETRNISQSNKYYGVQKSNANYVLQAIVNYYQHRTNVRHYDGLGDEMFDENEESDDDDDFDGDFLAQNKFCSLVVQYDEVWGMYKSMDFQINLPALNANLQLQILRFHDSELSRSNLHPNYRIDQSESTIRPRRHSH
ncbi:MAG: hypothetical protein EZS28_039662 [Streblomastix strix]|uniref:Uncharacterized protein n=1 Tax=Streblomastix strix TaxID=222440 RepID=A0A5J4U4B6_9EUKA|nr:MAG: hypothetical protein EZS28_039662 [Streblomastix strix]